MAESAGSPDRLTRKTFVRDALPTAGDDAVVVGEALTLREVALEAEKKPAVRVLAVVGGNGQLSGVIRVPALCDDLFLSVAPEDYIAEILRPGKLEEFGRYARSESAKDLMEEPFAVSLDDDIGIAFRVMHDNGLEGIPVIDREGRPVSYLDRFRLIAVWLKTHAG